MNDVDMGKADVEDWLIDAGDDSNGHAAWRVHMAKLAATLDLLTPFPVEHWGICDLNH
jgi:hypothetical protein